MGGSDPNTAVLTAGNAAKNNVFCGGLCIAAVVVAISAAYSAYAGGGNPLAGLDVIAEGKDPIQKMLTTGVAKSVAFSYSRYPNATATVLHTLGDAIDTAGVWVRIVDDKTGNVISGAWDQIPPEYRKKIIGLADLGEMGVTLYVPASAMAKVIQGVKVAEDAGKAVTLGVDAAKGAKSVGGETAKNIVNGLSLKTELALKEGNILGNDGKLTKWAIETALKIRLEAGGIKNPSIIKALTKDGSSIKDWSKFKARTVSGPNESRLQVHFYKNLRTGKVDYETVDFKVKVVVPAIPKKPMP